MPLSIKTLSGNTASGQTLDYVLPQPLSNIRYVKVTTTASPSWVAWREVHVLGK